MKYVTLALAVILVLYTSPAMAYQLGSGGLPGSTPPGSTPPGSTPPSSNNAAPVPWAFTSPEDGADGFGSIFFAGTGPVDSAGALSVYSYSNTTIGTVTASEVQLQFAVIVHTDPGIDWVGPTYGAAGEGYATIMPAVGAPNVGLLTLVQGGGYSGTGIDLGTLTMIGGGDSVLFRIVGP